MATEVILPRVDMDMTVGRISRWYVDEGSAVDKGTPLFEIETDKAAMEIEAPASGVLRHPFATGIEIAVGTPVAWIAAPGEVLSAASGATLPAADRSDERHEDAALPAAAAAALGTALAEAATTEQDTGPVTRATPLARRLARQNRIELTHIAGSGPRGRVQAADIEAAVAATATDSLRAAEPAQTEVRPVARSAIPRNDGLNIVTLREGAGDPIVFVHGFGADLNGWRPLAQAIGPGSAMLAVDLPGHGGSALDGAARIPAMADRLSSALAAGGFPRLHLVAHSLGAAVAALAAESGLFPVRSLFLLSPAGLGPEINAAFLEGWVRARGEEAHAAWMQRLVADPTVLPPAFVRATARARAQGTLFADQAAVADGAFPDGTQTVSIVPSLTRLAIPVRVLFGIGDQIIPVSHGLTVPGHVALHRLEGVGHMPHLEAPALVARLILEHVRSAA